MNAFLERLHDGKVTLMLAIRSARTPDVVRIARATGHHSVLIDLEHSAMSLDVAASLSAAAADLGLTPFVRIPEREYGAIGRLLDCGAHGIVAPRVDTAAEAETISRACRFPPRGQRSQLAMVPMLDLRPTPATELNPWLDAATIVQILVETPTGIANSGSIAALDGVDMLGIGANDLTAELGTPGQYERIRSHVATAAEACRTHGKLLQLGGIGDLGLMKDLLPLGVCPLFMTGTDTELLHSGASTRAGLVLKEFA
ncbi:HpcH/HpaI aldolase family protein [Lentzea sp. CA-135723]|uniref:HpcH/HpaI aldolase family protein n=1 Tax=Lentzea sp. CA-135723 TaxID=3239950 RepID=UPI003D8D36A8